MKKINHVIFRSVFLFLVGISGFFAAQQVTLAAGSEAQSATGFVSYSVGQTTYENLQSASGKIDQGVQQPYEIYNLGTNENAMQKKIKVYPNPVKDFLVIDFNSEKLVKAKYQLFDGSGKLILQGELKNVKNDINTSALSSGMYILSISSEGKTFKTFKIIKK